tara:strand:- start:98 stop:493 length:396 start_codon:yes stop_codon:yes gene_type:complete
MFIYYPIFSVYSTIYSVPLIIIFYLILLRPIYILNGHDSLNLDIELMNYREKIKKKNVILLKLIGLVLFFFPIFGIPSGPLIISFFRNWCGIFCLLTTKSTFTYFFLLRKRGLGEILAETQKIKKIMGLPF